MKEAFAIGNEPLIRSIMQHEQCIENMGYTKCYNQYCDLLFFAINHLPESQPLFKGLVTKNFQNKLGAQNKFLFE